MDFYANFYKMGAELAARQILEKLAGGRFREWQRRLFVEANRNLMGLGDKPLPEDPRAITKLLDDWMAQGQDPQKFREMLRKSREATHGPASSAHGLLRYTLETQKKRMGTMPPLYKLLSPMPQPQHTATVLEAKSVGERLKLLERLQRIAPTDRGIAKALAEEKARFKKLRPEIRKLLEQQRAGKLRPAPVNIPGPPPATAHRLPITIASPNIPSPAKPPLPPRRLDRATLMTLGLLGALGAGGYGAWRYFDDEE